jgi:RimJ/RimL family protein N-acetyltransferase
VFVVTLETERLLLRLPTAADVDTLVEMHANPDVMRYLIGARPGGGAASAWRTVAMLLGHWQLLGYGQWVVIEKASGALVGRTGFWHSPDWPGLELSWLTSRPHWGKGFATEASSAALRYAFTSIGAERIISLIHPRNAASIRVALKLGESFERKYKLLGETTHVYSIARPV